MEDNKGYCKKPVANSKPVGPQGLGGPVAGQAVLGVAKQGIEPQKIGGGIQLVQGPVQPPVGK